MPIQFCCTQCGQPIEVDDEHAGRSAACPYCQHVIRVPDQSTFTPGSAITARGLAGPPPTPDERPRPHALEPDRVPALPRAGLPGDPARAARLGTLALLFAGISVVLLASAMLVGFRYAANSPAATSTQPDFEQLARDLQSSPAGSFLTFAQLGMLVSAFIGAGLATASLAHSRANWAGWTALAISAGLLLCVCGALAISFMLMGRLG